MHDNLPPDDAGYVVLGRAMYDAMHAVLATARRATSRRSKRSTEASGI